MRKLLPFLAFALLAACAVPPPSAYEAGPPGSGRSATATVLGRDTAGETCTTQPAGTGGAETIAIYCGTWDQPSAEVARGPHATAADLMRLATTSRWRAGIDARFACPAPTPTTITGGASAVLLSCTRRIGGWPQVALVALAGGTAYFADGVGPALPMIEREVGVLAGIASPRSEGAAQPSGAEALMARRLAAQAFSSGDISQYQALMAAGTRANLAESFAAAEQAFRAALAVQEKALGAGNPNTVTALTYLALQISNQGRFAAADRLFARAAALAPHAADPAAEARLLHCEGLDALNQGKTERALSLLGRAETSYAALVPPEILKAKPRPTEASYFASLAGGGALAGSLESRFATDSVLISPIAQSALLGVIETRRYEAVALRLLGRDAESAAKIAAAAQLARANDIALPILNARLARTAASTASARNETAVAATLLAQSATDFGLSLPRTAPVAETELLQAAALAKEDHANQALATCRRAAGLLEALKRGTRPDLLAPCLAVMAKAATRRPADRQALLGEMFQASQLAQSSITSRQIAEASARLAVNAKDPKVAAAIRARQDAARELSDLYRQRDVLAAQQANPGAVLLPPGIVPPVSPAALEQRIATARARLAEADSALQAAAPNYGQLVQEVVSPQAVFAALAPGEAFAEITLDDTGGYVFVLADGRIREANLPDNVTTMAKLVAELRASIEPTADNRLPAFDTKLAHRIYADTLGRLAPDLAGVHTLVVAPAGPLLAIPFGILLTGPGNSQDLAAAPWLLRRFVVMHVPAAANFVSLARVAGNSRATVPWFGFGDFIPVTLAQAQRTFPGTSCQDSARLFAGLPRLPYAVRELAAARELLGASPRDELLGDNFTAAAVMRAPLSDVRVLHFATHAILPSELTCQSEPAIVTSDPAGAKTAAGALLTSSDIMRLNLDANVVILSACNTGGPGGSTAGESLSGLARAFFFAGARSLLVTHWSVSDQAAAYLVADTLARYRKGGSIAAALRDAELGMLDNAGKSLPAALSAPFFWAPFAVIGVDRQPAAATAAAALRVPDG